MIPKVCGVTMFAIVLGAVAHVHGQGGDLTEVRSNRNDVRSGISRGDWIVVYGALINEAEYAKMASALAGSVACECPGPMYVYFNDYLRNTKEKVRRNAPGIAQDAVEKLLGQAFKTRGRIFTHGNIQVQAGVATYNRWKRVVYHEPRTVEVWWEGPFGVKTKGFEVQMVKVEKKIPLPNHHQPYVKLRLVARTSNGQQNTQPKVWITNPTNATVVFSIRRGSNWSSQKIGPNQRRWFSSGSSNPNFGISFDSSFAPGSQPKQYSLVTNEIYHFSVSGNSVDLYK